MRIISFVVRVLILPAHVFLDKIGRLWRYLERPRYQIRGACHSNGRCCEKLLLAEKPFLTWPVLRQLTHFWMEQIYPFVIHDSSILEPDSGDYFRLLSCRNLVDGRCREYWLRPRICREWPMHNSTYPAILFHHCGYWVQDQQGDPDEDVSQRRGTLWQGGEKDLLQQWKK